MDRDFRLWIDEVEALGLLRKVNGADWDQEIGAITDTNVKNNKYSLLFDKIKGYPDGFRILTGALLDSQRVALTLGLPSTLSEEQEAAISAIDTEVGPSISSILALPDRMHLVHNGSSQLPVQILSQLVALQPLLESVAQQSASER